MPILSSTYDHWTCAGSGFVKVDWYDRRLLPVTPESVPLATDESIVVVGLICNCPTSNLVGLVKGHLWYSIRPLQGLYYNLEFILARPTAFQDEDSVRIHLTSLLESSQDANLLLVRTETTSKETAKEGNSRRSPLRWTLGEFPKQDGWWWPWPCVVLYAVVAHWFLYGIY